MTASTLPNWSVTRLSITPWTCLLGICFTSSRSVFPRADFHDSRLVPNLFSGRVQSSARLMAERGAGGGGVEAQPARVNAMINVQAGPRATMARNDNRGGRFIIPWQ